jgi:DNA helicase-2/ATP-dependent DNA helicase PcrA
MYAQRTRFIPPPILKQFEQCAWPPAKPEAKRAPTAKPNVDVGARMRRMWS